MKAIYYIAILLICLAMPGCSNYQYLSNEELDGVTLQGGKYTTGMNFKIQATSHCPTDLVLWVANGDYKFHIDGRTSKIFYLDWYANASKVRIEYDTNCIKMAPKIGYNFLGDEGNKIAAN